MKVTVTLLALGSGMEQRLELQGKRYLILYGEGSRPWFHQVPWNCIWRADAPFRDVLHVKSLNPQDDPAREAYIPNLQMEILRPRREMTSAMLPSFP